MLYGPTLVGGSAESERRAASLFDFHPAAGQSDARGTSLTSEI